MKKTTLAKLPLGRSWTAVTLLAVLAVPRVVVQDFHLAENQPYFNALLSLGPGLIWVIYLLRQRVPHLFNTMLAMALAYGVMAAAVHQIAWNSLWGEGQASAFSSIGPRFSSLISSLAAGLVTGAALGAATLFIRFLLNEGAKRPR